MLTPICETKAETRGRQRIVVAPTPLTPRQLEVMQYVVDGKSYKEIAAVLHISKNTVQYHVCLAVRGMDAANVHQAIGLLVAARYVIPNP